MRFSFNCGYIWQPARNSYYMTPFHYNFQNGAYFIKCPHCGDNHIYHYTLHTFDGNIPSIEKKMESDKMSLEQMKRMIDDQQKQREQKPKTDNIDFKNIPQRPKAKVQSFLWKADGHGKRCLYLTLECDDGKIIRNQKYSIQYLKRLLEALESLGMQSVKDIKDFIYWNNESFEYGNPRLIPDAPQGDPTD